MIRYVFVLIVLIFFVNKSISQDVHVSVFGKVKKSFVAELKGLRFMVQTRFQDGREINENVIKLDKILSYLNSHSNSLRLHEIPKIEHMSYITRKFEVEAVDDVCYNEIIDFLEELNIDIYSRFYKFSPLTENQKNKILIEAIADARNKASLIATSNNRKVLKILSVDDANIYNVSSVDNSYYQAIKKGLQSITEPDFSKFRIYTRSSDQVCFYKIKVTFSVRDD